MNHPKWIANNCAAWSGRHCIASFLPTTHLSAQGLTPEALLAECARAEGELASVVRLLAPIAIGSGAYGAYQRLWRLSAPIGA